MSFNFEQEKKRNLPKELVQYVLKHSDLSVAELEALRQLALDLDENEFEYRIKIIINFFGRAKTGTWKNHIHNEYKYAKSVINSASFFENQRWVSNIPTIEETKQYLEERRQNDQKFPAVSNTEFHENVLKIKKIYQNSELFELNAAKTNVENNKYTAQRNYIHAFETIKDEETKEKLSKEIETIYHQFEFCELEYILFKNTMLNIYIFKGKDKYQIFKEELKKYSRLSMSDLVELRKKLIQQSE